MVGQAYLNDQQARPNGSHFGILVQAFTQDNLVASTQTDEDGRFVLNAARTDYTGLVEVDTKRPAWR